MDKKQLLKLLRSACNTEQQAWLVEQIIAGDSALAEQVLHQLAEKEIDKQTSLFDEPVPFLEAHGNGHGGGLSGAVTRPMPKESDDEKTDSGLSSSEKRTSYKILNQIGQGGMGKVFVAEQLYPIKRLVAIKILSELCHSANAVARFEIERQAMAMVNHPNIAAIHDGGLIPKSRMITTNDIFTASDCDAGRPYLVMEYIDGSRLIDYCDQERLTIRERLDLFRQVCIGVQHFHQIGIIHRDLKPSNVLVTLRDGVAVPKLIDFGLAMTKNYQLVDGLVFSDRSISGTLEYMSPEQAEGNNKLLDTRTDIYSLGVTLYELLTGHLPFHSDRLRKAKEMEARRIIREEEPEKPSSKVSHSTTSLNALSAKRKVPPGRLVGELCGELDWLVMKAMAKERTQRYATAKDLADDIENYLNDRPLDAAPRKPIYLFKKFVKRNRGPIVLTAAILLGLLMTTIGTTYGMVRAVRAEGRATQHASALQAVIGFMLNEFFVQADPDNTILDHVEPTIRLRDALERAAERVEDHFGKHPEQFGSVDEAVGRAFSHVGLFEKARFHLDRAELTWRGIGGMDDPHRLNVLADLAVLDSTLSRAEKAEARIKEVIERRSRVLGPTHKDTLYARFLLADMKDGRANGDEKILADAEHEIQDVIALQLHANPPVDRHRLVSQRLLADIWRDQRKYSKAAQQYRNVIAEMEQKLPVDSQEWQTAVNNYAACLKRVYLSQKKGIEIALDPAITGDPLKEAIKLTTKLCPVSERTLGPNHYRHLTNRYNLAGYTDLGGDTKAAISIAEDVCEKCKDSGFRSTILFVQASRLASVLHSKLGNKEKAREYQLESDRERNLLNSK